MIKTVFEESFIVCYLDDSIPVFSHRWTANPKNTDFRTTLVRMSELYKALKKDYPNLTWLGDTTTLGVIQVETLGWLKEKWTTILLEAGVRYHALVVPKDVFAKFAMTKFKDNLESHHKQEMLMCHFTDEETANQWLRKCVAKVPV